MTIKYIALCVAAVVILFAAMIAMAAVETVTTSKNTTYLFFGEVTPETISPLVKLLNEAGANDEITIQISSPGGDAEAGFELQKAILESKAEVTVIVKTWAASAAALQLCAADKVVLYPNAIVLFHTIRHIDYMGKVKVITEENAPDEITRRILKQMNSAFDVCGNHLTKEDRDQIAKGVDVLINNWGE